MATAYPATPESVARLLKSPTAVGQLVADLSDGRYIGDWLLSGRPNVEGGAIQYDANAAERMERSPEVVAPGSEYPLATVAGKAAQIAKTDKIGQDGIVTDEAITRLLTDSVRRTGRALINENVVSFDGSVLSLVSTAVTETQAASALWSASTAAILRDVNLAKAKITSLQRGYLPDTLLVSELAYAYLSSDPVVANMMARETAQSAVRTGDLGVFSGLSVRATPNMPTGVHAMVADRSMLGGIGFEDIGGGYQRTVVGNGSIIESKSIREDNEDRWRLRVRRVAVPYVTDPGAAVKITGVLS